MTYGVSALGIALNLQFERPASGVILEAHEDDYGNVQIGDGLTSYPDGSPVKMGDTLLPAEYELMRSKRRREFEVAVFEGVDEKQRAKLTQYQFDALVFLSWNIGKGAFQDSSVLRCINQGRIDDAAFHFGDWVRARIQNKFDENGNIVGEKQYAPDGKLLQKGEIYWTASRGLYRRHLSEACLFLGYDWHEACSDDAIELISEPVRTEGKYLWKDEIVYKTPWKDVLRVARQNPLPKPDLLIKDTQTVVVAEPSLAENKTLTLPAGWDGMTPNQKTAWLNMSEEARLAEKPAPAAPAVVVRQKAVVEVPNVKGPYGDYDPASPEKHIAKSKRVWGFFGVVVGWATLAWESLFLPLVNAVGSMPFVQNLSQMSPIDTGWKMGVVILMAGFVLYYHGQVKAKGPLK